MQRTRLARWLVTGALAGGALLVGAGTAMANGPTPTPTPTASGGSSLVQGANSSTSAVAGTGDANASNVSSAGAGPSANGTGGGMSSQIGDNSTTVDQSSTAKSGDAVAGSQVTGVVGGDATVQQQNSATSPVAISGDANATSVATAQSGPVANATGTGTASASQIGDNTAEVVQENSTETGPVVAGGQVMGIVGLTGESTVQNQNSASSPVAVSGDAISFVQADVNAGPLPDADDGDALASQVGDNDASLSQASQAVSGDVVSGSQVTGGVVGGATVQHQNTATSPVGTSGTADSFLSGFVTAGPTALSSGTGNSQSTQNGSNAIAAVQEAGATTGDAIAGSQVTGLVGQEQGHLAVQNQMSSENPVAVTGPATTSGLLVAGAGPVASTDSGEAQGSQIGDSDVVAEQALEAETGDAVSGGQVTGAVGGSDVTIQNQAQSDNPVAQSGPADADATGVIDAGAAANAAPDTTAQASQIGDASASLAQDVSAASGDAIAGGQITGVVVSGSSVTIQEQNSSTSPVAGSGIASAGSLGVVGSGAFASTTGTGEALATQNGDTSALLDQSAEATTGDAVAGGQVTGVVATGTADVTVQSQNDTSSPVAFSSDAIADNLGFVDSGAAALAEDGTATASQIGDADAGMSQEAVAASGDAVSGAQVVGVVATAGEVTVQVQNDASSPVALSGTATAFNDAELLSGASADASTADALASQVGNDSIELLQIADSGTGDAVSGSQVVGQVGDADSTVQGSNINTSPVAFTAGAGSTNSSFGTAGPRADSLLGTPVSTQNGSNAVSATQDAPSRTGDSLAGAQVFGAA